MVSKARLDLPDPDRPVNTIRRSRGSSTLMFLRLCSRAPRTLMFGWLAVRGAIRSPSLAANACSGGTVGRRSAGVAHGATEVVDFVSQAGRVTEPAGARGPLAL